MIGNSQYQMRRDFLTSFVDGRGMSSCLRRRERKYSVDGALERLRLSADAFREGRLSVEVPGDRRLDEDMISSPG